MTTEQVIERLHEAMVNDPAISNYPVRFQGGQGTIFEIAIDHDNREVVCYTGSSL